MANSGPHSNGSQFFMTFASAPHLNGKHVVFGKVVDGLQMLELMERFGSRNGQTRVPMTIEACGEIDLATGEPKV